MRAVGARNTKCVELLTEAGVDVSFVNERGESALTQAAFKADLRCLKILLQAGADVKCVNESLFGFCVNMIHRFKTTEAILICIQCLIESGADVKTGGLVALQNCVFFDRIEEARFLIKAGADVNAVSKGGESLLTSVQFLRSLEITKLFIESGANVNKVDSYGNTPLIVAAEQSLDSMPFIKLLLRNNALINQRNNQGHNALTAHVRRWNWKKPQTISLLHGAGENLTDATMEMSSCILNDDLTLKQLCRQAIRRHMLD